MTDDLESLIRKLESHAPVKCNCHTCGIVSDLRAIRARYELKEKAEPEPLPLVTRDMIAMAVNKCSGQSGVYAWKPEHTTDRGVHIEREIVRASIEAMLERLPRYKFDVNLVDAGGHLHNLPSLRRALLGAP